MKPQDDELSRARAEITLGIGVLTTMWSDEIQQIRASDVRQGAEIAFYQFENTFLDYQWEGELPVYSDKKRQQMACALAKFGQNGEMLHEAEAQLDPLRRAFLYLEQNHPNEVEIFGPKISTLSTRLGKRV